MALTPRLSLWRAGAPTTKPSRKTSTFDTSNPHNPTASIASASADVTSNNLNNQPSVSGSAPSPAANLSGVSEVVPTFGLTPEFLDALRALNGQLEQSVDPLTPIPTAERRRYRVQANGDREHTQQIRDLAAQRPGRVPLEAQSETLDALLAVRDRGAAEAERLRASLVRIEDAVTLAAREIAGRVSSARAGLKAQSRYTSSDLKAQLKRAGNRFGGRKRKPAAAANPAPPAPTPAPTPPAGK